MGIDISGNSCGRAGSSAVDSGGDAVFCGGLVLYVWMMARGERSPTRREWRSASLLRNGDLRLRLRAVVLGRAACAFGHCRGHAGHNPSIYGVVGNYFFATQRLTVRLAVALLIGIGGVAVLMSGSLNLGGAPIDKVGALALIFASMSWSVASALTRKLPLPASKVMSSGAQMLAGGVFLALTAAALGEFRNFHPWDRLARSVARAAVPDCRGLDRRVYRLRVADSS